MSNMAYFWTIALLIAGIAFVIVEGIVMIGAAFDIARLGQTDTPPESESNKSATSESR